MTEQQNRPQLEAVPKAFPGAETIVADSADDPMDARPRCTRCGHPLVLPRSVARAFGPKCWTKTAVGQLDARRDAVGRRLGSLARRVALLDVRGLAVVSAALEDAVDALDEMRGAR